MAYLASNRKPTVLNQTSRHVLSACQSRNAHALLSVSLSCQQGVAKADRLAPEDVWLEDCAFQLATPVATALLDRLPFLVSQLTGLQQTAQCHMHYAALFTGCPWKTYETSIVLDVLFLCSTTYGMSLKASVSSSM